MITNTLMLKLKERNSDNIKKAQEVLLGMKGKIPELLDVEAKINIRSTAMSYDILLITKFNSMADFESYISHPVHVEVSKYVGEVLETGAAVCYES
ncbi:stress responsive A/B barrel domain protein [Oxobacter pfennigii]|uniref:Stress responsive A/B barrel domain protein n=1 Tax=Oxobacter pfennigii TaxID=36849 RepID=A0A0P8W4D8_9CLOT|nr:Dabb family protein [Oxobacter pfennigii]KPU42563.1 stress responsive A/B barrel domain protein [Oxobacter pfennigii]